MLQVGSHRKTVSGWPVESSTASQEHVATRETCIPMDPSGSYHTANTQVA
jgi:hypothetical protein